MRHGENPLDAGGWRWRAPLRAGRWSLLGTLLLGTLLLAAMGGGVGACGGQAETPVSVGPGALSSGNAGAMGGTLGSGGGPSTRPSACVSEVAMEGGMQRCENGLIHRVAQGTCPNPVPPESLPSEWLAAPDAEAYPHVYPCLRNADCADKPFGRCVLDRARPTCVYGCATDDDCNAYELCQCEATGGLCVPATCRTDTICSAGRLCAGHTACGVTQFLCQSSEDECAVDGDCPLGLACQLADFNELNPLLSPAGYYHRVCRSVPCSR